MCWAHGAGVLTQEPRQTARPVLDGEVGAVLHISAGLGRVIFVMQHWNRHKRRSQGYVTLLQNQSNQVCPVALVSFTGQYERTTHSRRCPVKSSAQRAPTGLRSRCQRPPWTAEEGSPGRSLRNTEPGKTGTFKHIYERNRSVSEPRHCVISEEIKSISQRSEVKQCEYEWMFTSGFHK